MLGAIMGYAEMALERLTPGEALHGDIQEILKAGRRSAEITQQLLAFASRQIITPRIIDLNAAIDDMLKMLGRLIGENISLAWTPHAGDCKIEIDPAQLNQILANLCVNARDAITGQGTISLTTRIAALDRDTCAKHQGMTPGCFVVLTVSDTGHGMDRETLEHLFEPFRTTKRNGMGVGLSISRTIIEAHGGRIWAEDNAGGGAVFSFTLPRAEENARV